jgi:hypothetical protein
LNLNQYVADREFFSLSFGINIVMFISSFVPKIGKIRGTLRGKISPKKSFLRRL